MTAATHPHLIDSLDSLNACNSLRWIAGLHFEYDGLVDQEILFVWIRTRHRGVATSDHRTLLQGVWRERERERERELYRNMRCTRIQFPSFSTSHTPHAQPHGGIFVYKLNYNVDSGYCQQIIRHRNMPCVFWSLRVVRQLQETVSKIFILQPVLKSGHFPDQDFPDTVTLRMFQKMAPFVCFTWFGASGAQKVPWRTVFPASGSEKLRFR